MKKSHKYFGYFLGLVFKINVLMTWNGIPFPLITYSLIPWEVVSLILFIILKVYDKKL